MDNGGYEAMLYDLLHYDLTGFNVRQVPHTGALDDEKIQGLKGAARWLYEQINNALICRYPWGERPISVPKDAIVQDYQDCSRRNNEYKPEDVRMFFRRLKEILRTERGQALCKDIRPARGDRSRIIEFPTIREAKAAFQRYIGSENISWDETDDDIDPLS